MKIQLIEGQFSAADALEIITQLVHTKIKFHENKISNLSNEEDIKSREEKIKRLQKNLYEIRKYIETKANKITISSIIDLAAV
jgi:hypothetical protein